MINFILNEQDISTDLPSGTTVLDLVRYQQNLKGTKIGCREGDCGACTTMVGELIDGEVRYRTMTSCLMPIANAAGKHIVTVEGINPSDGGLTPVQQAMVDSSGTQCGFCTVGFVMSLTGFCVDGTAKTPDMAVSAIDGNICRCTGYKSIERAACSISEQLAISGQPETYTPAAILSSAIEKKMVPAYFGNIKTRLQTIKGQTEAFDSAVSGAVFVGGGTDLYVQRHDAMAEAAAANLFDNGELRGVRDSGTHVEIGGSATVTDLLESPLMNAIFPDLYKHLKLVSSTPIRNMATLAGNFINASPIGDMTVWFLALDAKITLGTQAPSPAPSQSDGNNARTIPLRDLYLGYKQLAKSPDEYISSIRFRKPAGDFRFNFEKVCKRTYLDIATVNTAISLTVKSTPGEGWVPPALSEPGAISTGPMVMHKIESAHVAAGGVGPIPLYLLKTSEFLVGKTVSEDTISQANEIMHSEISPISDVRGTESYKRLLLKQLFQAHFVEIFGI
ncbi:MAG: FAD binding domain-containing protein [Acidobacteriota bacterium]